MSHMVDPDALVLPPCVRKARKKDSTKHWASTDAGWRPSLRPPAKVSEHLLSQGILPEENCWVVHERRKREDRCQKRWLANAIEEGQFLPELEESPADGEELAICEEDEPRQNEMLSLEESAAKSEIWHEVNKDLLEFWALTKRRRGEKEKKKEQQRKRTRAELEHANRQNCETASSEKRANCVVSAPKGDATRQPASSSTSRSTGDSAGPVAIMRLHAGDVDELAPPTATTDSAASASSGRARDEGSHTTLEYDILVQMERRKLEESLGDLFS
eukprot:TRINITY_DN41820_c0_g1_i1.p1 TRINITY_DN41820_c0_g1~~TRINITY_DN41820_c0_g1_i1.p1  ORF type:complete len:274 (+),score=59.22 TRINITY_DN41820_c0_g1_i1:29-850(+)